MGVTVHRFKASNKYHAKFMVADRNAALIATQNLTRKCFTRTLDFLLVTQDAIIVAALEETSRRSRPEARAVHTPFDLRT